MIVTTIIRDSAISFPVRRSSCAGSRCICNVYSKFSREFLSHRQISVGYFVFYSYLLNISCQLLDFLTIHDRTKK